jgi:hypothetical protein
MYTYETEDVSWGSRRVRLLPPLGAVLLGFLIGFLVVQATTISSPPAPRAGGATARAAARPQSKAQVGAIDESAVTYYLVGSEEDKRVAEDVLSTTSGKASLGGYAIAVVASPEDEALLRSTIDDANRQVDAYGEPGFRIVDLR